MRFLLRLGQRGKALDKALFGAIEQKDDVAVAAALKAGADPNARAELLDSQDVTPLMLAAWQCVPTSIGLQLLTAGAQVNSHNAGGTALHRAAWRGDLRMIALLFKHGADVRAKDTSGQEPRIYALAEGHAKAQRLLDWLDSLTRLNLHGLSQVFLRSNVSLVAPGIDGVLGGMELPQGLR